MDTSQDVNPLDNFFRNTLENQPDTPSESGWDVPSERVWQQVQIGLKTPRAGWGTSTWVVFGAAAIVIVGALFLIARQKLWPPSMPETISTPATEPTNPASAVPVGPSLESATPQKSLDAPKSAVETAKKAIKPAPKTLKTDQVGKTDASGQNAAKPENPDRQHPNSATPLPGSKEVPHNSKEANEQKKNDKEGGI